MLWSPKQPQWRRIYRQTLTLIYKNFLTFYKAPISTAIRALVFPIVLTVIFCELRHIAETSSSFNEQLSGISSSSYPIKDLSDAVSATSQHKLVFVRNGISNDSLGPVIEGILHEPGMAAMNTELIDDADDLFAACHQSLQGSSDCFAAIIFVSFNETNVEYIIALDDAVSNDYSNGDYRTDDSFLAKRLLPIQWAVDSHIGNFSTTSKPSEQPWSGSFGIYSNQEDLIPQPAATGLYWLSIVGLFVAPIFILILIGIVYHLSIFVAKERETDMAALMAAQMVTIAPRIMSTILSFLTLYFPGFLASSILLTQILFTRTSDILFLFLTLLAGTSLTVSSHFMASFFSKSQLAGLYTSVLVFALALIILADTLASAPSQTQVVALAALFPPITWATLVHDVATREYNLHGFSLAPMNKTLEANSTQFYNAPSQIQAMNGYLYVVFFILQIIVYGIATYLVEQQLWGVARNYDRIEASSDIAVRCTGLSKTYHGKRLWYWPFKVKGSTVVAVDSLNLEVKKGSVTFLLGPNGGGKTTSLKCIAGMVSMDAGSHLELNEAGEVFGICPQHNVFWSDLTVQEHIKIWRKLKTAAFEDLTVDDDDVLGECDLLEKADAKAKTLSGGQMRKLQLAISFVGASKVCCIDEASSGLDPMSRRHIWNIIQKGHSRRTILVTTHFLDEADVLADHITIMYKGRLVCEGPGTSLKARFGDDYIIRSDSEAGDDTMVWRTSNSAEATRKILELESLTEDTTYNVVFPTLEQVFLKVTSTSNTAVLEQTGDGIVGEEETNAVIDEKIFALETENARDIDLDVGHSIGLTRQIATLFRKRYTLLLQKSSWIAYGINLLIPLIIASALVKFMYRLDPLQTCQANVELLRNSSATQARQDAAYNPPYTVLAALESYYPPQIDTYEGDPSAFIGPPEAFSGSIQDDLYLNTLAVLFEPTVVYVNGDGGEVPQFNSTYSDPKALNTRKFVNDSSSMIAAITNSSLLSFERISILAPTPENAILFHDTYRWTAETHMQGFSLITNRIRNSSTTIGPAQTSITSLRTMRHVTSNVNFLNLPITLLIVLAFITASSIAVIYPAYEKINHVRALHYCNGVSPFALWFGYLLFDIQFIIIQAFFVWGLIFAGSLTRLWYGSSVILGVFILFGIATYLGTYVLSLFVKKAAFAIAAGLHVLLAVLYLVSYIMNQSFGNQANLHETYSLLQYGLGLSSPGANLARALFLASNSFDILCGKYGDADTTNKFAYVRYGSVYANLLIQILFLIAFLAVYEYGSSEWFRRHITYRGVPARLHYIVETGPAPAATEQEKDARAVAHTTVSTAPEILRVSQISKFFGKLFAAENISFDISSNQTLALLGGNGAGKTTVINMIRGELKPDFGDIFLDGTSVLRNPHKARLHMGVCPQDDAVDNLRVRQTLAFYASVKGLKNVESNVDKVLNALNITIYENLPVKALSGGTKRKLSVAIALLGNPRVLLLDEPSTGQDAGAKRILWKALQDISANRAILLTTHSMEEAEALATNVAIMGTRMLATGTLSSLQETYGGAFGIRAVRVPEISAVDTETLVNVKFENMVSNYEDSHGQISFNLPHDKRALGAIMKVMEGLKGDVVEDEDETGNGNAAGGSSAVAEQGRLRVLQDYTITGPTLEEVFMNVARESGIAGGV